MYCTHINMYGFFKTKQFNNRNELIRCDFLLTTCLVLTKQYILIHMKIKNNKILFTQKIRLIL